MTDHSEQIKSFVDVTSAGVAVGTIAGWLPHLAALFTIIWTGLRIYEWAEKRWWKE